MSYNDDEPIVAVPDNSGNPNPPVSFVAGRIRATIINKPEAPLEETEFKAMVELTGAGLGSDRAGVDLVTVLDVSGSMRDDNKLAKLKTAMQFVIKKLSPIDRLSVVTFSDNSTRLCPLRQITEASQKEIVNQVNALAAAGWTNITAGLQTALKVLNDRRLTTNRVVAIMLMSDGLQNRGGDAAAVPVGSVPVCTFGFGNDYDPKTLRAIADNSAGGTFSDVQNTANLSVAFSQCLAGLLTVVVQDLKLTITRVDSSIKSVSSGNYPQSTDNAAGSVTVSFGDLYEKEVRKVMVDLLLPPVTSSQGAEILQVNYTYKSTNGQLFESNLIYANVQRTGKSAEDEKPEVIVEGRRLLTARVIKEARVMADNNELANAKNKLATAQSSLDAVVLPPSSDPAMIEMLKSELQQMLTYMETQDVYNKQGRPFAYSSETSHDRQRFAARGDVDKLRLFATPRMDAYLEQAKKFDQDPSKPLPTADADVKQELSADPLGAVAGALSYHVQAAIQSLQSLYNILNTLNR